MLIIGAKGFAKEVLEILFQSNKAEGVVFFDNINEVENNLYGQFPILTTKEDVKNYFSNVDKKFTIGIGEPFLRYTLFNEFKNLGGEFTSTISPFSHLGHYNNRIGNGSNVMTGVIITNDVSIGVGVLINLACTIGHDSLVEDFVELSPGVKISGNCKIGRFTNIGTNATILPKIKIGQNVIVGAGSVVTKDIPDNSLAVGVPAKIIKNLEPLNLKDE